MVLTRRQRAALVEKQDKTNDENNQTCDTENEVKIIMEIDQSDQRNDSKIISEKMKDKNPWSVTVNVSDNIPHDIIHDPGSSLIKHHYLDHNTIKMLLIQSNGEQKLITFDSPTDDCTVKDLLDEAKIPIDESLGIFIVKEPRKTGINYIVKFMLKTDIMISEENNNKQIYDYNECIRNSGKNAPDITSGFFSSTEENTHGDFVINENDMIIEKKINEIDNNHELVESEEDKSVSVDMKRKKHKRPIAKRKLDKDKPKCSFHMSSDEEDSREKGNSGESEIENKTKKLVALDNEQKNNETEEISEKETVITNSYLISGSSGATIDYGENIKGGGVLQDIQNMEYNGSIESPHTFLTCRTIMIGSHNYTPQERVIISQSGVIMKAPHIEDETNIVLLELKFEDIVKVVIHFGEKIPAIFLYVIMSAGETIRECLGMEDPEKPYYKSLSRNNTQRLITILPKEITEESELILKALFTPNKVLAELDSKETEQLLLTVSPKNIRAEIKSLFKVPEKTVNHKTVENTLKKEVKTVIEKAKKPGKTVNYKTVKNTGKHKAETVIKGAKRSRAISTKIKPTFDNIPNIEIKEIGFQPPKNPLETFREYKSRIKDSENEESQSLLVYPPSPAIGGIAISKQDFACLKKGQFLNDIIIDFYLKYLSLEVLSKKDRDRTYIFSIHFFKKLTQLKPSVIDKDSESSPAAQRFANVKKWTKHVNIFEKDFIIVPINHHSHWFLAIICFPALVGKTQINSTGAENKSSGVAEIKYKLRKPKVMRLEANSSQNENGVIKSPCILLFDSLAGSEARAQSIFQILRQYLYFEYAAKVGKGIIFTKENIEGACPKVPQQNNFSDCGLYVLQYVESFFNDPIKDYNLPINTLEHWFDDIVINNKRREIFDLLIKLKRRR